jgi:peptidoglycan/xylan/chitin deacetylase (PgdA/CDA1 family)
MKRKFKLLIIGFLLIAGCSGVDEPMPSAEGRIIVLMYHRIVNGKATNLYERSIEDFEADLKYLVNNDIKVISFNDLENVEASGKMPEGNSAVITFDDGDNSCYTLVRPLLLQYKMKATFFLWAYMIGHDSFLTWNEVELMSNYMYSGGERPFLFGSHTYSHQYLLLRKSGFNSADEYNSFIDYELRESKKLIESHTAEEVSGLSLPFGDGAGDADIITATKRNGYKYIRTSVWGAIVNPTVNLFEIPSLPMLDTTNPDQIEYYLNL